MEKRSRIFQNQTAMVRVLVNVKGSTRLRSSLEIISAEVFPLGFTHCADSKDHFFHRIEDEIKKAPEKMFLEIMEVEPGLYEVLTEYRGRVEVSPENEYIECVWKVFQPHVYQLTEEDIEMVKVS